MNIAIEAPFSTRQKKGFMGRQGCKFVILLASFFCVHEVVL
jgi:hypothetical protein